MPSLGKRKAGLAGEKSRTCSKYSLCVINLENVEHLYIKKKVHELSEAFPSAVRKRSYKL